MICPRTLHKSSLFATAYKGTRLCPSKLQFPTALIDGLLSKLSQTPILTNHQMPGSVLDHCQNRESQPIYVWNVLATYGLITLSVLFSLLKRKSSNERVV